MRGDEHLCRTCGSTDAFEAIDGIGCLCDDCDLKLAMEEIGLDPEEAPDA